ncbi:MAG: hypothetical protein GY746_17495 [Gammaproteobacteria bacterium]|nr:hypothetical protein [Gammaproteobacteria bacterium]
MTNPNDIAPPEQESPDYFVLYQEQIDSKASEIIRDTELLQEALDVQIEDVIGDWSYFYRLLSTVCLASTKGKKVKAADDLSKYITGLVRKHAEVEVA